MQRSFEEPRSTDCSICLEHFRRPRLLPCGHTFCTRCLQRMVAGFRPNYILFSQRFCCPLCRKVVEVPPGGVKHFPSDVFMVETFARRKAMQRTSTGNDVRASELNSSAPPRGSIQTKFKVKIPSMRRSCGIAVAAAVLFVAIIVIVFWCSGLLEEEDDKPKFLKSTFLFCQHFDRLLSGPEEEEKKDWYSQLTDFFRQITDKIYGPRKDEKIKTWWEMLMEYLQVYYEEFCTYPVEVDEDGR